MIPKMHYGVIVDVDYKDDWVRCYDEVGANYERDRNNVQLKHCPPPFTKVSRGVPGKVYARADMENPVILQKSYLSAYSLQILERGTKVPNADMKKIFNCRNKKQCVDEAVLILVALLIMNRKRMAWNFIKKRIPTRMSGDLCCIQL